MARSDAQNRPEVLIHPWPPISQSYLPRIVELRQGFPGFHHHHDFAVSERRRFR
jgi:hypothetical protein